jgi:hypothetical protein
MTEAQKRAWKQAHSPRYQQRVQKAHEWAVDQIAGLGPDGLAKVITLARTNPDALDRAIDRAAQSGKP